MKEGDRTRNETREIVERKESGREGARTYFFFRQRCRNRAVKVWIINTRTSFGIKRISLFFRHKLAGLEEFFESMKK